MMLTTCFLQLFRPALLLLFLSAASVVHAQSWVWQRSAGGARGETVGGLAVDSLGSCYVVGTFARSIAFDQFTVFSNGQNTGCYIAKYNALGRLQWAAQGNGGGQFLNAVVATDRGGNSFVAGTFTGTVSMGGVELKSAGKQDIFIARFSYYGILQWARHLGDVDDESALAIALDSNDNVTLGGAFSGNTTLGAQAMASAGDADLFVARYDSAGAPIWGTRGGGAGDDRVLGLAVDGGGNVFAVGAFHGSATLGGATLQSGGGSDIFVAKIENDGVPAAAARFGSAGDDVGTAVACDARGRVFLAGAFNGTVPFGGVTLTSGGGDDLFLARTDGAFAVGWALRGGGGGADRASALALDNAGNPYVVGSFTDSASFGGAKVIAARGASLVDVLVARADAGGTFSWARAAGGAGPDEAHGVGVDAAGEAYVGGTFTATATFGDSALVSVGDSDLFVGRLGATATISTGEVLGSPFCAGTNFPVPYGVTGVFASDNVFTAQLSDTAGSFASPTAIGSLAGTNGSTLTAKIPDALPTGRRYRIRVVSSSPPITGIDNGMDLVIHGPLNPVIVPGPDVKLCSGSTVTLDGGEGFTAYQWSNGAVTRTVSISEPGKYAVIVFNEAGCVGTSDSVTVTTVPSPPKPTVVRTGQLLESSTGDTYQWLRNDQPIPGATAQRYLVTEPGIYTVRVMNTDGCFATSDPEVFTSSVADRRAIAGLQLYPLPSDGLFTISFPMPRSATVRLTVLNLLGLPVMEAAERVEAGTFRRVVDIRANPGGTYVVHVEAAGAEWIQKVIKR